MRKETPFIVTGAFEIEISPTFGTEAQQLTASWSVLGRSARRSDKSLERLNHETCRVRFIIGPW